MKKVFKVFGILSGILAGLFAVYYFNLDMKLMRSVVLPFLDRHHDSVRREHLI
ncbi:MAG: hypothetical protein SO014_04710 [Candidatus Limivicinus sp.]|nr:hypothetical protein [Clostridiales bacterium]MDY3859924.1 hypothetical protein [Candidatus Limivicinus sp.]